MINLSMLNPEKKRIPYSFYKRVTVDNATKGIEDGEKIYFHLDYGYNFLLREVVTKSTGINIPVLPEATRLLKSPIVEINHIASNRRLQNAPIPLNLFSSHNDIDEHGQPLEYFNSPSPVDGGGAFSSRAIAPKVGKVQNEIFIFREPIEVRINFDNLTQLANVPNIIDIVLRGYLLPAGEK